MDARLVQRVRCNSVQGDAVGDRLGGVSPNFEHEFKEMLGCDQIARLLHAWGGMYDTHGVAVAVLGGQLRHQDSFVHSLIVASTVSGLLHYDHLMPAIVDTGPDWGAQYDDRRSTYAKLLDEVLFALRQTITEVEIKTHTIDGRVKDRKSFLDKIRRKGYAAPFDDMPDITGARVVCLFVNDLPKVQDSINQAFEILKVENKLEMVPDDSFGYMSVHFECRIRDEHNGPRYDSIKGINFEIQSRTLLMDAWANVSHYLAYKGAASVPAGMRRSFNALSGLFYVADQQFQTVYDTSIRTDREAADAYVGVEADALAEIPIDRATVLAMLERVFPKRILIRKDAAEFAEELRQFGYDNLAAVEKSLLDAKSLALEFEASHPPAYGPEEAEDIDDAELQRRAGKTDGGEDAPLYWAVGIARQALDIADPRWVRFRRSRMFGAGGGRANLDSVVEFEPSTGPVGPYQIRFREQEATSPDDSQ